MIKLIAFVKRKPSLTHEEFQKYYEERHVPLIMDLIPLCSDYRRNYLNPSARIESPVGGRGAGGMDFDAITEVWYTEDAFARMQAATAQSDIGERIAADEENFVDRSATIMWLAKEAITPSIQN
ncbi:MAG: EthD domain-containing protein [Caulobacterales bacterium]